MSIKLKLPLRDVPPLLYPELEKAWVAYCERADEACQLLVQPDLFFTLPRVWACSPFIAKPCQPVGLNGLLERVDLLRAYADGHYHALLAAQVADDLDEAGYLRALRVFRRREMVRIAWRDLAGWAEISESFRDLSDLADALIRHAADRLYRDLSRRYGEPRNAQGHPQPLVVIAMGKLGGRELNFSSDIDLIFAYPQSGETQGGPRSLDNQEFFTRLGQKLVQALNTVTEDGFVFRVDMRLRPFGESGPLAISFSALEDYYQAHAREWERYALIKARVVTGGAQAEETLMGFIRPFVYRRYLDYGAFEALRDLKSQIDQEMRKRGREEDLKLGLGGIREVEFICQAFQLIRGGRQPALQTRHLPDTLNQLEKHGLLPAATAAELRAAYVFLRRAEHALQEIDDRQTQVLPQDEINRTRLAYAMNFPGWDEFYAALSKHRETVHGHFREVISYGETETPAQGRQAEFQILWNQPEDSENNLLLLGETGFSDPPGILAALRKLKESYALRSMSRKGQERLDSLMPQLLDGLAHYHHQDLAFQRIIGLVEAVARRSVYFSLLLEHPQAISLVIKLFADSEWIAGQVTRYPLLLDEMLDPRHLYDPLEPAQLDNAIQAQLAQLSKDDLEMQMDTLRQFKRAQILHVAVAELSGNLSVEVASDYLTAVADSLVKQVLGMAWHYLVEQYGQPMSADKTRPAGFCVVAYGKAGAIEMSYSSDLDIVFLHDSQEGMTDGLKSIENSVFFNRLAKRIIHLLTTQTAGGVLYEVDSRLRPGGRSGLMVIGLDAFRDYEEKDAWTWEHQALIRARGMAGDPACQQRFEAIRREILTRPHDPNKLRQDVLDMRQRMRDNLDRSTAERFDLKQGRGGVVDIEFLMQYSALRMAGEHPGLLGTTGLLPMLKRLVDCGFLSAHDSQQLGHAYRTYRTEIHHLALQNQAAYVPAEAFAEERAQVAALWARLLENSGES